VAKLNPSTSSVAASLRDAREKRRVQRDGYTEPGKRCCAGKASRATRRLHRAENKAPPRWNRAVAASLRDALFLKPKRAASSVARHGVARFRG